MKIASGLKFRIWEVERLYYLCSENKGADQLLGFRTADLGLCFSQIQKSGFLASWLIFDSAMVLRIVRIFFFFFFFFFLFRLLPHITLHI